MTRKLSRNIGAPPEPQNLQVNVSSRLFSKVPGLVMVATIVFVVSGAIEFVLNVGIRKGNPWVWGYHVDSFVVACAIASLFYLWRRKYRMHIESIEVYSASRRIRLHRIRSMLTILMYHADEHPQMKKLIYELNAYIDEPVLDPTVDFARLHINGKAYNWGEPNNLQVKLVVPPPPKLPEPTTEEAAG